MKKSLLAIITVVSLVVGVNNASAISLKFTDVLTGPDVYSGQTVTSTTTDLASDYYTSITGTMVDFYPVVFGNLRSSVCVSSNTRTATFIMYEDDVYPNADDKVKTYTAQFTGLKMVSYEMTTKHTSNNIDSTGDNSVELYHTTYVSAVTGDRSGSNGPLITYQYSIYNSN